MATFNGMGGTYVTWSSQLGLFLATLSGGPSGTAYSTATSVNGIAWQTAQSAFQPQSSTVGAAWNGTVFYAVGAATGQTLQNSTNGLVFNGMGNSTLTTTATGICWSANKASWLLLETGATTSTTSTLVASSNSIIVPPVPVFSTQASRCTAWTSGPPPFTRVVPPTVIPNVVSTGIGGNSIAYTINNGASWTPVGVTQLTTNGYDVGYSATLGMWIAVGAGTSKAGYSTDGFRWNTIPSLTALFSTYIVGIAYSDNQTLWIAAGAGTNSLAYSTTGSGTWTAVSGSPFTATSGAYGIAYSPERNIWVASGPYSGTTGNCIIAYSTTGTSGWTQAVASVNSVSAYRVRWAHELGIFVTALFNGPQGVTSYTTASSVNGIAWSMDQSAFQPTATSWDPIWNGSIWYLIGNATGQTLSNSTDGITWNSMGNAILTSTASGADGCWSNATQTWFFGQNPAATNNMVALPASSGSVPTYQTIYTSGSSRCVAWTPSPPSFTPSAGPLVQVNFVATGSGGSSLAYSINGGQTFTPIGLLQFSTSGADVAYSYTQAKWIAVGSGTNAGVNSSDGIHWSPITSLNTALGTTGTAIARSDQANLWMAGGSGTNKLATSPDGVTWTVQTTVFTTAVLGIAYSPYYNTWVATGTGTWAAAYSTNNGVTWVGNFAQSPTTLVGAGVAWSQPLQLFLAVFNGVGTSGFGTTVATSTTGVAWITSNAAFQNATTFAATGVAWNGTQFQLSGTTSGTTVDFSTDGVAFTSLGNPGTFNTGNGICWGSNTSAWVSVGTPSVTGLSTVATRPTSSGNTYGSAPFSTSGTRCAGYKSIPDATVNATTPPTIVVDMIVIGSGGGANYGYSVNGGQTFTPSILAGGATPTSVTYSRTLIQWLIAFSPATYYSPNGFTWTAGGGFAGGNAWGGLARSDQQNLYVGVGSDQSDEPLIGYSTNGVSFSQAPILGIESVSPKFVAFSPDRSIWVTAYSATSGYPMMWVSTNGVNWVVVAILPTYGYTLAGLTWIPELGYFLLSVSGSGGGNRPTGYISYDGYTWQGQFNVFTTTGTAYGSAWNGTAMYVVGSDASNNAYYSTDGVHFTGQGFLLASAAQYVCYGSEQNRWVFTGSGTTGSVLSISSTTGARFRSNPFTTGGPCASRFTFLANHTVPPVPTIKATHVILAQGGATYASGGLAYSVDGGQSFVVNYAISNYGVHSTYAFYDVAYSYNHSVWIAVGSNGAWSSSTGTYAWSSLAALNTATGAGTTYTIARSETQDLWIAGGAGTNKLATSPGAGTVWTARSSPFTTQVNHVAYSRALNIWVAAGSGTASLAYSANGITWTLGLAYSGGAAGTYLTWAPQLGLWLATFNGASAGGVSTAISTNGTTWTPQQLAFEGAATAMGSAWNGSMFYLGGASSANTLMTSTNALTYTGLGTALFSALGQGMCWSALYSNWVLLGTATPAYVVNALTGSVTSVGLWNTGGLRCATAYNNVTSAT